MVSHPPYSFPSFSLPFPSPPPLSLFPPTSILLNYPTPPPLPIHPLPPPAVPIDLRPQIPLHLVVLRIPYLS